jgi:hypothetical protein
MNDYEQKQQRRRQRLADRADRKDAEAHAAREQSDRIISAIPPGQPILVGHHSERRHRRDLDRSDRAMRKSIDAAHAAAELRDRAAAIGTGGISSDDPDALSKLQVQLDQAQAAHQRMVAANKLLRADDRTGLLAIGFTEAQIARLLEPDDLGRIGFPDYQIKNSGTNIRRLKARIAELPQRAEAEAAFHEIAGDGWRIFAEDNRICIAFDHKPDPTMREKLKAHGFRWTPTRNAWTRQFNNSAVYWARYLVGAP